MNDLSEAVERLTHRLEALESRVSSLEQKDSASVRTATPAVGAMPVPMRAAPAQPGEAGVFSVLGKSLLAVAGAYLLRALEEWSALPRIPLIALAILYAFFWLIPAARARGRLSSLVWAATAAIILLPMLWELTLRFAYLSHGISAGVLSTFVVVAAVVAWQRHFAQVAWVVEAAASLTALALALVTHDFVPFLAAQLVVVLAGEVAAARQRTLRVRPLVAAAADCTLFALIWIYSSPAATRTEYPPLNAALLLAFAPLLLFIYAGSASTQTLLLGHRISFFETAQTLIAFLLSVWGVLVFWSGPGMRLLGVICLFAAGAGYPVAFLAFMRAPAHRNFHVYATGSLALLLAGCWLSLSGVWRPLSLTGLAIAATLLGAHTAGRTLAFHGLACLFAAAVSSGFFGWVEPVLAGRIPAAPGWIVYCVSAAAMLGYTAIARAPDEGWPLQVLRLFHAALALIAAAALLVWALVCLLPGATPAPEHLAIVRTVVGCALAVLLAWSGSLRRYRERVWLAWTCLVWLAAKLLFEDRAHGHLGFTAAAIFVYALTLLAVPRLLRLRQGPPGTHPPISR